MTKQITKENVTYKEIEACLQEQHLKLKSFYWKKHEHISRHGYNIDGPQNSDTVSLGKIAEAQQSLDKAISAFRCIPRK